VSGARDLWRKLRRGRQQLTVELAEGGVAPESEVRETEERIEAETERHGEHTPSEGDTSGSNT
jgi:hypothetical protein